MDAVQTYARWLRCATDDPGLVEEMRLLSPRDAPGEIEDRFGRDLAFGTGGLRGVMGAGTDRMNIYTVRRATQGLANWLLRQRRFPSVALAYDSRLQSDLFASETARVLAANGIRVWAYPRLMPTPALSFAVRHFCCDAGVCITASHNPAQYNGYKVFGPDGGQVTDEAAAEIQQAINSVDPFDDVRLGAFESFQESGHVGIIGEEVVDAFLQAVHSRSLPPTKPAPLRVVYTPLNGTGRECVCRVLGRIGVRDVLLVPEQAHPDGNFPTCPTPNPEEECALQMALDLCEANVADLMLATDPDCDRVGVAVRRFGEDGADEGYIRLSGNEIGVLLFEYICRKRLENGTFPDTPLAVKTIVTTDLARHIADAYGVELREVLTGFKYIGEQVTQLEGENQQNRFLFGFEESCGYLPGAYVRDKDAVSACMLICQMAQDYKSQGKTLAQAMEDLNRRYGYYANTLHSFTYPGPAGTEAMRQMLDSLRREPPTMLADVTVVWEQDYLRPVPSNPALPPSDMLEYTLRDASRVILRPSGTEPKIKLYIEVPAQDREAAGARAGILAETMKMLLGTGGYSPPDRQDTTEKTPWASTSYIPPSRTTSGEATIL